MGGTLFLVFYTFVFMLEILFLQITEGIFLYYNKLKGIHFLTGVFFFAKR